MPRIRSRPPPPRLSREPHARRPSCRWRVLGIGALVVSAAAVGAPPPGTRVDIDVHQRGRTFVVDATLRAPVPPAVAWEVLTDFEHMESFVPNLADSHIVARDGNRLTILQHGVARFGLLSVRFESERLVTLTPPATIRSTQLRGSMEQLDSLTTFAPDGSGTRLTYHVEAIPGTLYPDFVARHFLRHEVAEQFDAIAREMVRRHSAIDIPSPHGDLASPAPAVAAVAAQGRRPVGATTRAARPASASARPG